MKRAIIRDLAMAALILTAAGGCLSPFEEPSAWQVELSSLDYIQFLSSPPPRMSGERPVVIKVELAGSGHLTYSAGRSDRVSSSFWTERDDAAWDDMRRDQMVLSKQRTEAVFQSFVDLGFFGRKFPEVNADAESVEGLVVLGSISKRKKARITDDPRVWAIFDGLLREF